MFPVLLILWLILSGVFTLSNLIKGIIICSLITWIFWKYLNYSPKRFYSSLKKIGSFFIYVIVLVKEIIVANVKVLFKVWNFKKTEPLLVDFSSSLKSDALKVIVSSSITLTPGTFTVSLKDDTYVVHALDKDLSIGEESCVFFKMASRMED